MGYKAIIDSNITLAFNLLRDLAEDVVLNKSSDNNFDFSTGEMAVDRNKKDIAIKAVVIEDNKSGNGTLNAIKRQILFKTRGLGDINAYDKVIISGNEWNFGPMINNDGYTILAEIYREI